MRYCCGAPNSWNMDDEKTIDVDLIERCMAEADKVEFLSEEWEYEMYVNNLYNAAVWGGLN